MRQEIIDLYDAYTHETLDRRAFLDALVRLTGSAAAAAALVPLLEANPASAAMTMENDPAISAQHITYPGTGGEMGGYLVRPADASGPRPGVLVIHENRGLNPHIEDVARRVALAGFVALAPDFLSPAGGTPADSDEARNMIRGLDAQQTVANATASHDFLMNHAATTEKTGAVGFCWGGGLVNQLAVAVPELDAAVAFYGRQPAAADVPKIRAALLLHYAGLDERINAGIADYEAALEAAGKTYTLHMYEGVNHAFHNDTAAARYDKAAAELAWSRTIAFFNEHLSG